MNRFLALPAVVALGVSSCETMRAPITSSEYDPLAVPGSGSASVQSNAVSFRRGQMVRTIVDNTGFYRNRPRGSADADRLLARNTRLRVVSSDSNYVRVELDSGELGFVPTVMVEDPTVPPDPFSSSSGNEVQVSPPVGGPSGIDPIPFDEEDPLPPDDALPPIPDLEAPVPPEPDASPVVEPAMEEDGDELPPSSPGVDDEEDWPSDPPLEVE
jgi:hypothetical protein